MFALPTRRVAQRFLGARAALRSAPLLAAPRPRIATALRLRSLATDAAAGQHEQQREQKHEQQQQQQAGADAWLDPYSKAVSTMHWIGAAAMVFLMGSALAAQQIPTDETATEQQKAQRWNIMFYHESVGMVMLFLLVPRLLVRLASRSPKPLPEPTWQLYASNASHAALYATLAFMPISGYLFGYLSGWGVPFFVEGWEFAGAPKEQAESAFNKKWEKFFYENHHRVGNILTYYLFPLHIGAIAYTYFFRGMNILRRLPLPTLGGAMGISSKSKK